MNRFNDLIIRTKQDLEDAVQTFGFVPFFKNAIPGFSIAEHVAKEAWFGEEEGVWEWKGPVIRETGCAYGKFFDKKAVFISREWFPDFANFRRDGYDFDALFDDELASYRDKELFDLLSGMAPVKSRLLKEQGDYRKGGKRGFDTIITRLQQECYVVISDFLYETSKDGRTYGWGVAEYSTPEIFMGEDFTGKVYQRTPEESMERVLNHLKSLFPEENEKAFLKLLRGGVRKI